MNHSRKDAPVRFCPSCGKVVNTAARAKCDHQKHSTRRKDRDQFCVDCGLLLKTA